MEAQRFSATNEIQTEIIKDIDRTLFTGYLEQGGTIITDYYVALLDKVKVSKRTGKLSKAMCLQDNASLQSHSDQTLNLLIYLASLVYNFFSQLKEKHPLKEQSFQALMMSQKEF